MVIEDGINSEEINNHSETTGTIEIGHHHNFPVTSFIRALVEDDLVWESADDYPTVDAALADLKAGLGEWIREMGDTT
jgi:hypothetical protein